MPILIRIKIRFPEIEKKSARSCATRTITDGNVLPNMSKEECHNPAAAPHGVRHCADQAAD